MRIPRASVKITSTPRAIRTMAPAVKCVTSSFGDQRRGALDLHHLDARARLDHVVLIVGAGAPHLTTDLHPAGALVDLLERDRPGANEGGSAGADPRRRVHVAAGDWADDAERGDRPQHESQELGGEPPSDTGHDRRERRGQCDWAQEETHTDDLAYGENHRRDRPHHPVVHFLTDPRASGRQTGHNLRLMRGTLCAAAVWVLALVAA